VNAGSPLWVHTLTAVLAFGVFLITTALLIWGERRVVSLMQTRVGPNRVGPLGVGQTLIDGAKMFFKEDITPSMVDRVVYTIAPLLTVVVGFLAVAVIPYGGTVSMFGETFVLQAADINVGVLWFLAMGSLHVYGVVLAGWASQSPYPLMGGVRSSAQMISYEIAQGLAVASVFIWTGSLRVSDIIAAQDQAIEGVGLLAGMPAWNVVPLFPAFVVFLVGMVAEAGRPPFDLAEAEGELVAGFLTEYSGLRFGMFMLAEFMNVVTMSAIMVTLFFGGPLGPTFGLENVDGWVGTLVPGLLGVVWFLLKTVVFIFLFILLRGSLPRMKYRVLLVLGWKVLIPIGLAWAMVTGLIVVVRDEVEGGGWIALGIGIAFTLLTMVVVHRVMVSQRRERGLPSVPEVPLEPVVAEQRALESTMAMSVTQTATGSEVETPAMDDDPTTEADR
jgi:NADH-quinone oxidoreductase subunit H